MLVCGYCDQMALYGLEAQTDRAALSCQEGFDRVLGVLTTASAYVYIYTHHNTDTQNYIV